MMNVQTDTLRLFDIARWLGLALPDEDKPITGVSIDTRTLAVDNLFVALPGTKVDGHVFIADAVKQGAAAVLCTTLPHACEVPVLVYPDLEDALARMATAYRVHMPCRVVALTGSNGKTTVKEMLASILPKPVFATPGNWNNHLGVPLSVMQLNPTYRYAVFELGANHAGEIAHTVAMVKPHVTLINNIASAHIEGFGSLDGTARAKGEIHQGLCANGTAVINADDAYADSWHDELGDKSVLRFSAVRADVDVYARDICMVDAQNTRFQLVTQTEAVEVCLRVPGMHHVYNALAAATCALALGCPLSDIATGLLCFSGVAGRLTPRKGWAGALILDDTYNANVQSICAGIDVLSAYSGVRIAVLGDMVELGVHAEVCHAEVGDFARKKNIDMLLTCGMNSQATAAAFGDAGMHFKTQDALIEALKPHLNAETTVLVKGSRSSSMEHVVDHLLE
jgi:UDP-N-acetylmuramoyl-tripeptide--D-alanyl-D-alanine ligase